MDELKSTRMLRLLAVAVAALLALLPGAVAAQSTPAPPAAAVDADRVRQTLAPGVGLETFTRTLAGATAAERVRVQVIRADLSNPAVSAGLLYPGAVAKRELLTATATRTGALGGVNGDFFDIENSPDDDVLRSDAPNGTAIADGELLKSFDPVSETGGRKTALIDGGEVGRVGDAGFDGALTLPDGPSPLAGLNRFRLQTDDIGAYTSRWGSYPRRRVVDPPATEVHSVLVRDGKVVETGAGTRSGPVPAGSLELVGREQGARRLAALAPGAAVGATMRPTFGVSVPGGPRMAVSGVAYLVRGGELTDDGAPADLDTRGPYPRTGIGFGQGGRTMMLVVADGRQVSSTGIKRTIDFSKLMRDLGAVDALHLDGGGSATMVARQPGDDRATVVNTPSDGAEGASGGPRQGEEREVPNGVGVFYTPGGGDPGAAGVMSGVNASSGLLAARAPFAAGFAAARPSVVTGRRLRLPLFANERARLRVEVHRRGRRIGRFVRAVGPGTATVTWRRTLRPGAYRLRLEARTPAGEVARARATLRVRPRLR